MLGGKKRIRYNFAPVFQKTQNYCKSNNTSLAKIEREKKHNKKPSNS